MDVLRNKAVPLLALAMGLAAIFAIAALQQRSESSRDAQLKLSHLETELTALQLAPFKAARSTGGSPVFARRLMQGGEKRIQGTLRELRRHSPTPALSEISRPLAANFATLQRIYVIGATTGHYDQEADGLAAVSAGSSAVAKDRLDGATHEYDQRATRAHDQANIGSTAVILLLLGAFAFLYRRAWLARAAAQKLSRVNASLLKASRREALTDALTGLANRRRLTDDLDRRLAAATRDEPLALVLFDLDGFKTYNDSFGHPAGDALLVRLAERLQRALGTDGTAYRMGGDEFCVISAVGAEDFDVIVERAAEALHEASQMFDIGCSYGVARLPLEAGSVTEALRLADQRMYGQKTERASTSRQTTDVLLQVLQERDANLSQHLAGVVDLTFLTARRLGLAEHEVRRIALGAELHDIGKSAIPQSLLDKPGPLDEREWAFIRRHTEIGERIVNAAPALAHTAEIVRACHERLDGKGYPDRLAGDAIPLGARIIAVCDAFDAMISHRPYAAGVPADDALAELRRCAGTQFDPDVVEAFCDVAADLDSAALTRGHLALAIAAVDGTPPVVPAAA
jgi:diguanylate cyclase (GGDEF)-like protein